MITTILLVFAFVLFALATWRSIAPDWNRLVAAGLAFMVLAQLLAGHALPL